MKPNNQDLFLEKRLETYDNWLKAGETSYASRVEAKQWAMPEV